MDPEPYRIRPAREDDVPALPAIEIAAAELFRPFAQRLELAESVFENAQHLEDLEQGRRRGLLWVAADAEDRPVGFALATWLGDDLHLEEMDVHPRHQQKGLGRALVERVAAAAGERGCALTLSTFREVPWNAPFYSRLGFRELPAGEWTPSLAHLRDEEARRGLRPGHRVLMRFEKHIGRT